MTDVETAGAYLLERYAGETHEIVYELCLDRKGKLLACKRLNDGGASSAALDIREVTMEARDTTAHILKKFGAETTGAPFSFYRGTVTPVRLTREAFWSSRDRGQI